MRKGLKRIREASVFRHFVVARPDTICFSGAIIPKLAPKFKVRGCHQSSGSLTSPARDLRPGLQEWVRPNGERVCGSTGGVELRKEGVTFVAGKAE